MSHDRIRELASENTNDNPGPSGSGNNNNNNNNGGGVPIYDAIRTQVAEEIDQLDEPAALQKLQGKCDEWNIQWPNRTFEEILGTAFSVFGVSIHSDLDLSQSGHFGLRELDGRISKEEMTTIALYNRLRTLQLLNGPEQTETFNKIMRLLEIVFYSRKIVISAFQSKLALHSAHTTDAQLDADLEIRLNSWSLRFRWINEEDTNPTQRLLLHLLDCAMEKRYRKTTEGYVYEPIFVGQYSTHAYRQVCDIRTFVYQETRKELDWAQWCNLTTGNNCRAVVDYLTNCNDYQFPILERRRDVFAFKNGIYVASQDVFYSYASGSSQLLSQDVIAAKYFDIEFTSYDANDDWYAIPTPFMQSILDHQHFSEEVSRWLYILLGRMLYNLNEHDGWQCIPYLRGLAGTGKSLLILKVVKCLYGADDCGVLSNSVERIFGISAFYDKKIWVAPELRNDFSIDQSLFQSIISGEEVSCAVKHKQAFACQWSVPGICAGNEIPNFADGSGSIQRRLIVFNFDVPVVSGDMRLGDRIQDELPLIILKINRAYRTAAAQMGSQNIWATHVLPAYFHQTRSDIAQTTSSLESFLASSEIALGPDMFCPYEEFIRALKEFERNHGFKEKKKDADFFRGPFTKFQLTRQRCVKTYRGERMRKDFLIGLDLSMNQMEQDNVLG